MDAINVEIKDLLPRPLQFREKRRNLAGAYRAELYETAEISLGMRVSEQPEIVREPQSQEITRMPQTHTASVL